MKKEILRMEHIVCSEDGSPVLNHFSMQIFKGEIYGLLCLEQHGITKMIELICRNQPIQYGQVFFEEKLVNHFENNSRSKNRVTLIGNKSCLIDSLSLADNLFVIRSGFRRHIIPEKAIRIQTRKLLNEFQIRISPLSLAEELTTYERLVVELLRAMIAGNRLIILWQVSDLLSSEELLRFHELIRKLAQKGYTFLYIYNHHEVLRTVCDRISVFENGHIEKVFFESDGIEEKIRDVFARYSYDKLLQLKPDAQKSFPMSPVLELKHICTENMKDFSLSVRPGENVLILDQSNTILWELSSIFSGIKRDYAGKIEPENLIGSYHIAVIPRDPTSSLLFPDLSYLDNLCFPLSEKVPFFWQKQSLRKSILKEFRPELGDLLDQPQLYDLHSRDLYQLIYYRYLIVKPRLIICMQPLSGVDMYIRTYILEMITKLCKEGIAVLTLNTELYDTLYTADRIIQVENGRIINEFLRDEFEKLRTINKGLYPD